MMKHMPLKTDELEALQARLSALERHASLSAPGAPKNQYDVRRDFGAKGDGNFDDTKPVQAAIDAALGAGTSVYIPRGIYRITSPLLLNIGTYDIDAALR